MVTPKLAHFLTPSCPVRRKWMTLRNLPWGEFFKQLPEFLRWRSSIKAQVIDDVFVCSYYRAFDDWDVWVSFFDPRKP